MTTGLVLALVFGLEIAARFSTAATPTTLAEMEELASPRPFMIRGLMALTPPIPMSVRIAMPGPTPQPAASPIHHKLCGLNSLTEDCWVIQMGMIESLISVVKMSALLCAPEMW